MKDRRFKQLQPIKVPELVQLIIDKKKTKYKTYTSRNKFVSTPNAKQKEDEPEQQLITLKKREDFNNKIDWIRARILDRSKSDLDLLSIAEQLKVIAEANLPSPKKSESKINPRVRNTRAFHEAI